MREFVPGLEGVLAFETQIAEPDPDGGALRYRGVDVADLVGCVSFGNVWGLLVDGEFNPGIPPAEPFPIPIHSGDVRVDVQSAIAMLAPAWGLQPILDIDDDTARENLAHVSVMALSFVAQSARGLGQPMVPQAEIDQANTVVERFMIRWRGDPDPRHVEAIDSYFVVAAEHGLNSSTLTARVSASTGADVAAAISGAIGTMSGPLHGGAPARVLSMIEEVENSDDAATFVRETLDADKRLMGFGHRVYRAEDPRARILRNVARDLGATARPGTRDERRVLVRRDFGLRRSSPGDVHLDVHLRPHRRLERPHSRAEENRTTDPAICTLHRAQAPAAR